MYYKNTIKEIIFLLGVAVVAAFSVNFFSPSGIALIGQWDESKGVVSANAKDDTFDYDMEIEDLKIAKQVYDSGKAFFVDARSSESFEEGHIKGSVSLPIGRFETYIDGFKDRYPTTSFIVTYCSGRTCHDSHMLAQSLFEHGYMNVSIFIDGYPAWEAEGYPIEK